MILVIVAVVVLAIVLIIVGRRHSKSSAQTKYQNWYNHQITRLEDACADACDMIGGIAFVSVKPDGEQLTANFSIYIQRLNKSQRFTIFIGMDALAGLDDKDLSREAVSAIRYESQMALEAVLKPSNYTYTDNRKVVR